MMSKASILPNPHCLLLAIFILCFAPLKVWGQEVATPKAEINRSRAGLDRADGIRSRLPENWHVSELLASGEDSNKNRNSERSPSSVGSLDSSAPSLSIGAYNTPETDMDYVIFGLFFDRAMSQSLSVNDVTLTGTLKNAAQVVVTPLTGSATDYYATNQAYYVRVNFMDPDAMGTIGLKIEPGLTDESGNVFAGKSSPVIVINQILPDSGLLTNGGVELPNGSTGEPVGWIRISGSGIRNSNTYLTNQSDATEGSAYLRATTINSSAISNTDLWSWYSKDDNLRLKGSRFYRISGRARTQGYFGVVLQILGSTAPVNVGNGFSVLESYETESLTTSLGVIDPVYPADEWVEFSTIIATKAPGTFRMKHSILALSFTDAGKHSDFDAFRVEEIGFRPVAQVFLLSQYANINYDYGHGVIIKFHAISQSQSHKVMRLEETPLGPGLGRSIGHYWELQEPNGSFSATATFEYEDTEIALAGLQENSLQILRRADDGIWHVVPSSTDSALNQITIKQPVTAFSDWTIGQSAPTSADCAWQLYH